MVGHHDVEGRLGDARVEHPDRADGERGAGELGDDEAGEEPGATPRSSPKVATTSASHSPPELRLLVASSTAGSENIRLATTTPTAAPTNWAPT